LYDYDLFVIGSGPAGQRAAIQAAKLGKRVAIAERKGSIGGGCINTGTIPSKTLREAVLNLVGDRFGATPGTIAMREHVSMPELLGRAGQVIRNEVDVTRSQLLRNGIDVFTAEVAFADPHRLRLGFPDGLGERLVSAENIVIGTGTVATRDPAIPFDGERVLTSEDILQMQHLPRTMAVVGAGIIGCEYASMFAALGVRVTLIDKRPRLLPQIDEEVADTLVYHLRQKRVTFRLGEEVSRVLIAADERGPRVHIGLGSLKHITVESALYSIGRTGATAALNLVAAGLCADGRGNIAVNEQYQTVAPHIYAVGDVIGYPGLAATSMEQGRLAACHMFGVDHQSVPALFPYGIYAIPEISMVGRTERELTEAGVAYEVGRASYREIARGQILGDETGMMKLLFHTDTRELLGVHIIGTGATELVHIGQAVMAFGGGVDYLVNTVFNYPTLAECYKTAALDAANRLAA
jgi:NAD(P) transhydrogenase